MKKAGIIIISIFCCFLSGFISSRFQTESILTWYPSLNKPSLTPPNYIFPIAWSILYLLMGISIGLILSSSNSKNKYIFKIFLVQLALNFTWSIIFFYFQNPLLGLINILLLDICIIYYIIKTYSVNKISSILFIPYIIWVGFASYLNLYILLNN